MACCHNSHSKGSGPNAKPSTTFVQADPSNFRSIVQKLTGSATTFHQQFPSTDHKLPISNPSRHAKKPALCEEVGRHMSVHKLHERRKTGRKLEITLNREASRHGDEMVMSSPVSTLDGRSSGSPMEEEEIRAIIAEKGYYLHRPSPIKRSEPQLLVLFPLDSPN